jgi:hypothetical protein
MRWLLGILLFVGSSLRASAQSVATDTAAELSLLSAHAAVIFVGQVADITRNGPAGFVDIRFRIDQSLRGAPPAGAYVLREWIGLWTAHPDRYVVGQRRLMLLPARSSAGFSAPIADTDGAIPILASPTSEVTVDLRWIQARSRRTSSTATSHTVGFGGPPKPTPSAEPSSLVSVLALLASQPPTQPDARF